MKKKILSLALALAMCLPLLPAPASAVEGNLPDWYFLFAIFKNVDADCDDGKGMVTHTKFTMSQEEIDLVKDKLQSFEEYMNDIGVMRAHMYLVEIDTPVTELEESGYGSYLGPKQAAPLLEANGVNLDYYDHVSCFISLNVSTKYGAITEAPGFENGTGHACHNLRNIEFAQYDHKPSFPGTACAHEFLHFLETMSKKWGEEFDFHAIGDKFYTEGEYFWRECYTDIILNQVNGDAGLGTGVPPAVWQYPPHVLRTMAELTVPASVASIGTRAFQDCTQLSKVNIHSGVRTIGNAAFERCTALTELTIPSGVIDIGEWAFQGCSALTRVSIPASVASIEKVAFYKTGLKDVYYAGTEAQWKAIQMGEYNEKLTRANIHYNHLMADVKTTDWFAEYVQWAMGEGIAAGTGGGKFSPARNCTVAEILTFLYKAYGAPEVGNNPYTNVKASDWYAKPAIWAHEQGLMSGSSFNANTPCTRAMVVEYLWKLAGSPSAAVAHFEDVPGSASFTRAVNWAVENGVTAGVAPGRFGPDMVCTRAQIVTFLYSALA